MSHLTVENTSPDIVVEITAPDEVLVSVSTGASNFLALTDTPSSYAGQQGKVAAVKSDESGLEFIAASGSGTVTSVALSLPSIFVVSGSPITTNGTLEASLNPQSPNVVWAGPATGLAAVPTFRALVAADLPDLSGTYSTVGHTHDDRYYTETETDSLVNATVAFSIARSNHTGEQAISTVTGLQVALDGKQTSDATLTAFAALTIAAHSLTVGAGADSFSQLTLASSTFPGRSTTGGIQAKTITDFAYSLIDDADAATARNTLGAAASTHSHTISDVTGLQTALDAKWASAAFGATGLDLASAATSLDARSELELGSLATVTPTGTPDGTKFLRDDNSWQSIPGGGDALTSNPLSQFAATTSDQLRGVISDETGTGALVFANTPTLVTPVLGVASATALNKVTITAPATSSTLTIADGATLTVNATATITNGTHSGTNTGDQQGVTDPGGTTGQLWAKASNDDYDGEWVDAPSGGAGGSHSLHVSPTGDVRLIPLFANLTTNGLAANTLFAVPILMEVAMNIAGISVDITGTSAAGGSTITLAIASESIIGGYGRPGTTIASGTVASDSSGVKTLAITPYAATAGERLWLLIWTAAANATTRVGVHTVPATAIAPYWNFGTTTVMYSGLSQSSITEFPSDLSTLNMVLSRYMPVIGLTP